MTKLDRAIGDGRYEYLNALHQFYAELGITSKHLYRLMKNVIVNFSLLKPLNYLTFIF